MTSHNRPPFWTVFPTYALSNVDWSDHGQAHRAVMRLFAPDLHGEQRARRAGAQILYRVEAQPDGSSRVLIQSDVEAELLPLSAQARLVPTAAWNLAPGAAIQLLASVTPIRRRSDKSGETRRELTTVVPFDEASDWFREKLSDALTHIDIVNHSRVVTRRRNRTHSGPPLLTVDTLSAVARVKDGDAFESLRRRGVGRAKAFGCGLLTAIPVR